MPRELHGRLGLNVPDQWWPSEVTMAAYEAAGFAWVQFHAPPRSVLCDPRTLARHARGLLGALDGTALRLVLHAPDELRLGSPGHDRAFEGLIDLVARTGAELVVYHGRAFPAVPGELREETRERCRAEERSLRRLLPGLEAADATLAIENLAPVHPGPARVCHDPLAVADLVDRLGSAHAGLCFDVGHANVVADQEGTNVVELLEAVIDRVALFHVHDNLGARHGLADVPGVDPIRLDLHLPPGRGTVPWEELSPLLAGHGAPLQLEIHPSFTVPPAALQADLRRLLQSSIEYSNHASRVAS